MRYVYGVAAALLVAGGTFSLATGEVFGVNEASASGPAFAKARPQGAITPHANAPESFAGLVEQLQPAVVNISTRQTINVSNPRSQVQREFERFFGRRPDGRQAEPQTREARSLGSGFIISADGFVITNNHVVAPGSQNATVDEITVIMPDRTEYEAELIGRDVDSDIAVLKIEAAKDFPFVRFGDSESARVGDWVMAIGNPFGLGGTVTAGIVSAIHRSAGIGAYDRFIQTDASINSGNSGGPMFNMRGEVIGINRLILSPSGGNVGIGLAIPSEVAIPIVETLRKGERVERGYLGVRLRPLTDDLADALGLDKNRGEFIDSVEPGESADKAGVMAGDVITKVNGEEVTPDQTLSYLVANAKIGSKVKIELIRGKATKVVTATLGRRPTPEELANRLNEEPSEDLSDQSDEDMERAAEEAIGLAIVDLNEDYLRQLRRKPDQKGAVVLAVARGSDAAQKGIRRGDIILSVNNRTITNASQVKDIVQEAVSGERRNVLLSLLRRGQRAPDFVSVRLRN